MLETFEIGEGTPLADRYTVIRRLGSGGMASVFLAEDEVLGREVAIKVLRGGGDTDLRRFRREARLGATLSHANLVTVFDTVAGDDGVLIVMEFVRGETLADALDRGPLDPERALAVLRCVAAGLDHAHSRGVVHRDVKPANVLLGEDGTVKLADLGIATAAEATRITTVNDIVGTLAYIAPERLDSASPGGPESDVYGLGVLAYEALGGQRLNRGSTPAEVVHLAATAPPPDLREAWPEAPAEAAHVLQRAMDRDPVRRPQRAGALVEELARALESRRDEDTVPFASPPPPAPIEWEPSTHRHGPSAALGALAAVALAAVVALVVAIVGGDDGGERPAGDRDRAGAGIAASGAPGQSAEEGSEPAEEPAPEEEQEPQSADSEPPEDGASADGGGDPAALNQQGFDLIQAGRHEDAIPLLQQAVDSYPAGTDDLDYAYALFNLGNALRLAGRPDEAIPVLEERLEIPNQRGVVRKELEAARAAAGD